MQGDGLRQRREELMTQIVFSAQSAAHAAVLQARADGRIRSHADQSDVAAAAAIMSCLSNRVLAVTDDAALVVHRYGFRTRDSCPPVHALPDTEAMDRGLRLLDDQVAGDRRRFVAGPDE